MSPSMPFLFACLKLLGRKVTNAPPLAGSYLALFSSYRRPSNFQRAGDSSSDSDSDDSDAEDHSFANDSDDPYHSEDVAFNPNFRQLSCTVRSLRYDKILRIGLNLTRSAAESAFLSSRLRLNGVKLLKKGVRVDEGDNLDFVMDFEDQHSYGKRVRIPNRLRVFLTRRPPLALCALVLTLSFLSLIGLDAAVHLLELRDPDVETHWNRLLLELSNLEFCFSNSTNAKTLADSFSAAEMLPKQLTSNVDHIVHYVHLHVLLYPTMVYDPGETYVATASMRGRHIAIKGAPALHPLNVTFEIRPGRPLLDGQLRDPNPIRLSSCVKLSSSQQILPRRTLRRSCHPFVKSDPSKYRTKYSRLEWTTRSDLFASNRCNGRIRIRTDFQLPPELLPVLKKGDIDVISFRLRVLEGAVFILLTCLLCGGAYVIGPATKYRRICDL